MKHLQLRLEVDDVDAAGAIQHKDHICRLSPAFCDTETRRRLGKMLMMMMMKMVVVVMMMMMMMKMVVVMMMMMMMMVMMMDRSKV